MLRYEQLGTMSRTEAAAHARAAHGPGEPGKTPRRSRVHVRDARRRMASTRWCRCTSTRRRRTIGTSRRSILFRGLARLCVADVTRQEIQAYVAHLVREGYAPKTIDHIHDVLSAMLRTAVKWGHLQENPARGVDLPTLRTVRPKWALTEAQAAALLDGFRRWRRTMVGLALLTGLRRGELFALRWRDIDDGDATPDGREAVYEGHVRHAQDGGRAPAHAAVAAARDAADRDWRERQAARAGRLCVCDVVWKADFAEQRLAALGVSGVRDAWDCRARRGSRSGAPTRPGRTTRACRARSSRS